MRLSKVMIIFWKEYDDVIKSKYILFTLIFLPFFMIVILPLTTYLPILLDPSSLSASDFPSLLSIKFTDNWDSLSLAGKYFVIFVEFNWLYFFIVPIMLPSVIASDSFTGERDRGTVEGLLAAPITDAELYFGKIATSFIPTVIVTWFFSIPYIFITNIFSRQIIGYNYLPNLRFILIVVFILPITVLITVNLMIWVSTRTSTTRDAQQLGGLILIPFMILLLNIVVVAIALSDYFILVGGFVLLIFAVLSVKLGIHLLDRERWLSSTS